MPWIQIAVLVAHLIWDAQVAVWLIAREVVIMEWHLGLIQTTAELGAWAWAVCALLRSLK